MDHSKDNILQSHTIKFLEAALRSDRRQAMRQADGHGRKTGDCGDTVEFFLSLQDDRIAAITYEINGCILMDFGIAKVLHGSTQLTRSGTSIGTPEYMAPEQLRGSWKSPEEVADYLESLPPDHFHCAELAVGAIYLALADAGEKRRSPWKKLYR